MTWIEKIDNLLQLRRPAVQVLVAIDPEQIDNLYRGEKFRQTE